MTYYSSDFSLGYTNGANIQFFGTGDTGDIYQSNDDTVYALGTNQIVEFSIDGPEMQVVDQGTGLQIGIGETVGGGAVHGFQNDPTGTVNLRLPTAIPTLAPDGIGGTMLTVTNSGDALTKVDFVGDPNVTMAQITGGDPPATSAPIPTPAPVPAPTPAPDPAPTIADITPASLAMTGLQFISAATAPTEYVAHAAADPSYTTNLTLHPGDSVQLWGVAPADLASGAVTLGTNTLYTTDQASSRVVLAGANFANCTITQGAGYTMIQEHGMP